MDEVIDEYYPEYCFSLEAAYGEGMMSEGGSEAIDLMFKGLPIEGKKALDIGSGLGGVPYYLAQAYGMEVTGLEINPWMVEVAANRAPIEVQDKLNFVLNADNDHLPFGDNSFDIVYSKGVLCHVEKKEGLFNELYRVLKPDGVLVINDWLSLKKGEWGPSIQRLVELEGLSLYAETAEGYIQLLTDTRFSEIQVLDVTEHYARYNEEIVRNLMVPKNREAFIQSFGEQLHEEAVEGYSSIARANRSGEGTVTQFTAFKK